MSLKAVSLRASLASAPEIFVPDRDWRWHRRRSSCATSSLVTGWRTVATWLWG